MTAPVTVSISILAITGSALPRARVIFERTAADIDGAIVAPGAIPPVTCDADGLGTASLLPNATGSQGTQTRVTIFDENGNLQFSGLATIPESDCNLHAILTTPAPATVSDAQAAANAAQADAAQTALDRIATAADRVQTGLDRVATGEDADATAADRAQTAQDVIAAAASAVAAEASRDAIDNRIYPTPSASDPTTRPDGSACQAGDEYFNSTSSLQKRFNGSTWVASDINTANLAASGGAALVGFTGGLSNEVSSTVQAILRAMAVDATRFGCVGDGVTDDTVNYRKWIAGAGAYATLLLQPGKTYLLSGECQLLQGQTLHAYGAKVKRIGEKKSATTTAIGTGSSPTAITVADGTQFAVGMTVTVYNGSSYDPNTHNILTIAGNVVTVNGSFSVAFPSGGTLITVGELITSTASDVKILGLEVDGNRANNTSLAKWDIHCGIYLLGARSSVEHCYVHDEVSEGIQIGGAGCSVQTSAVVDCGGNGIHFSGSAGGKAIGNYVKTVNILGTAPGHADGAIIFSDTTGDSIISENFIDTAICGVGSIDTDDNSSVVISGNTIKNCTTTAIEGIVPATLRAGKVTVADNHIYDSQAIQISSSAGALDTAQCPYEWSIHDNYLENTRIVLSQVFKVSVHDNRLICTANTTQTILSVSASQYVAVRDNFVEGGASGIGLSGSYLKVHGNICRNQYQKGINQGSSGTSVEIHDNTVVVESTYTTNGSYYGIQCQNGTSVLNNRLNIAVATGNHCIYCPSGGVGVSGAFVQGNVVRSTGMTSSIRCDGGSQNNVITANFVQQAISNAGGASNTVSGNFTIL